MASKLEMGFVLSPSISEMTSPGWTPSRQAGVPSIGAMTTRRSSCFWIWIPSP